ncbi:histone deacetylase family protein [Alkalimonas mucilaginosa]|uniref:Histone deacetylase n=1 Tax=Alkalimonas mucilaginosa TaxID=3057676 RepID=A0ABU7JHI6_9GAMM|nr:histone deacetylase [Alkalimonas sp. MEB004]MEE2024580.1 histone deacetylase [Alkalimonas sp. MEB004]
MTLPLVYHPSYSALMLPERHRYPIGKYHALQQQLLALGVPASQFQQPKPLQQHELELAHCPHYIDALCSGQLDGKAMRRIGFPWSKQLIARSLASIAGTRLCAELALQHGLALHLSGGYHHAFYDQGSGFCLFNDLVFAAKSMQQQGVKRLLIFDLDVHQGDGTAKMLADNPDIITCSVHCDKNFPYYKQQSDWDLSLPATISEQDYLTEVEQALSCLLNWYQPELVLYDAGVDCHQQDELGHLQLSTTALLQRDRLVLQSCRQHQIPVAAVIGGGYQRDLAALTKLHLQLFKAALELENNLIASKIKT